VTDAAERNLRVALTRVTAAGTRWDLPERAQRQLQCLFQLLVRDPLAPTSVRDPIAVADDHIADALVALELDVVRAAYAIADLGSGAGIPGLALAIALPEATVSLVEASRRKCEFLAAAQRSCGVENAAIENVRAESWPAGLERFDLVTARALAPLAAVAEYAAPLLRVGGVLVAWRGHRDPHAEAAAARAAAELGLDVQEPLHVRPYEAAEHRYLHLMSKVRATPSRFPRREGLARKRPLGSGPRRAAGSGRSE
jgi:16S rRNA (guanine527-N7)-methyltransferase